MTYRLDLARPDRAIAAALAACACAWAPATAQAHAAPPPLMAERAPVTQFIVKLARP